MKAYKLLNQDLTSYNNTQWEIGKTVKVEIPGNRMCTRQVLHYYNHPILAILLNPIHANIIFPRLFEIEVDEEVNSDGLKFASKSQTLIKEIPIPEISIEQKVEIAIRIAKTVYFDEKLNSWADKWLDGSDRTRESAGAAGAAAYAASAADYAAAYAAYAAAYAANAGISAVDCNLSAAYVANAIFYAACEESSNKKLIEIAEMVVNRK